MVEEVIMMYGYKSPKTTAPKKKPANKKPAKKKPKKMGY